MAVEIYSADTIENIVWPATKSGFLGRDYLMPILREGVKRYIANIDKELLILKVNQNIIPLTVSEKVDRGAITASPYSHYLCMLPEEIGEMKSMPGWLKIIFRSIIGVWRPFFSILQFNKVVLVNNWLFSTTLYPVLTQEEIQEVNCFLVRRFPDYGIVWRSVEEGDSLSTALSRIGARLVFHRTVHIWDPFRPGFKLSSDFKKDCKKFDSMDYQLLERCQLKLTDAERLHELYEKLYIGKHSRFNPEYTEKYFEHLITSGTLEMYAMKKNNRIDGFIVMYCNHAVCTCPILGYDLDVPQEQALYRILGVLCYRLPWQRGLIVNDSAGASRFKKNRGCYVALEYLGVYTRHLPWWRSIPSKMLEAFNPLVRKLSLEYDT